MLTQSRLLILLCGCIIGCVKAPIKPNQQLCAMAQSNVEQRLGPEFRRVVAAQLLFDDRKGTYGCGIVYERVDEELAEEFSERPEGTSGDNHIVAFVSRVEGKPARFLDIRRGRSAPGPVSIRLETAEVTGDEYLDLIILEKAPQRGSLVDYQAIKIINGDPLRAAEIFETTLMTKSDDNVEFVASWSVEGTGPKPKLVIRGGPATNTYQYSSISGRLLPSGEPDAGSPPSEATENASEPEQKAFSADDLETPPDAPTTDVDPKK